MRLASGARCSTHYIFSCIWFTFVTEATEECVVYTFQKGASGHRVAGGARPNLKWFVFQMYLNTRNSILKYVHSDRGSG